VGGISIKSAAVEEQLFWVIGNDPLFPATGSIVKSPGVGLIRNERLAE
jgi:hypothetical protein